MFTFDLSKHPLLTKVLVLLSFFILFFANCSVYCGFILHTKLVLASSVGMKTVNCLLPPKDFHAVHLNSIELNFSECSKSNQRNGSCWSEAKC